MHINYKNYLFNGENILKSQQRVKSDYHEVYTEEVNKTALRSGDDKRSKTFDRITTFFDQDHAKKAYLNCVKMKC